MSESEEIIALFAAAAELNENAQDAYKNGKSEELESFVIDAISIYNEILKHEPDNTKALYFLGNKYYENNNFTASLSSYDKALEILEQDDELVVDVQINRSGTLCELQKYEEAINSCDKILTSYVNHPDFGDIERACTWIKNNCNERLKNN